MGRRSQDRIDPARAGAYEGPERRVAASRRALHAKPDDWDALNPNREGDKVPLSPLLDKFPDNAGDIKDIARTVYQTLYQRVKQESSRPASPTPADWYHASSQLLKEWKKTADKRLSVSNPTLDQEQEWRTAAIKAECLKQVFLPQIMVMLAEKKKNRRRFLGTVGGASVVASLLGGTAGVYLRHYYPDSLPFSDPDSAPSVNSSTTSLPVQGPPLPPSPPKVPATSSAIRKPPAYLNYPKAGGVHFSLTEYLDASMVDFGSGKPSDLQNQLLEGVLPAEQLQKVDAHLHITDAALASHIKEIRIGTDSIEIRYDDAPSASLTLPLPKKQYINVHIHNEVANRKPYRVVILNEPESQAHLEVVLGGNSSGRNEQYGDNRFNVDFTGAQHDVRVRQENDKSLLQLEKLTESQVSLALIPSSQSTPDGALSNMQSLDLGNNIEVVSPRMDRLVLIKGSGGKDIPIPPSNDLRDKLKRQLLERKNMGNEAVRE